MDGWSQGPRPCLQLCRMTIVAGLIGTVQGHFYQTQSPWARADQAKSPAAEVGDRRGGGGSPEQVSSRLGQGMCAPSCSSPRIQAHRPPALETVLASALEAPGRWSDSCGVGAHSRGSGDPRVRIWSGGESQVLPHSRPGVLGVLVPVLAPEAAAVDDDPKDEQRSHHTPRNARI